jgi:hypothetical protein
MSQFSSLAKSADRDAPDGAYAFTRLAVSLLIATLIGARVAHRRRHRRPASA